MVSPQYGKVLSPTYRPAILPKTSPLTRRQTRALLFAFLVLVCLILGLRIYPTHDFRLPSVPLRVPGRALPKDGPRIAKATMLYGQPNELYELALKTHERHSKQHGYGMHVLQRGITGGYWNKLAFLLKLVVQELERPESERTDWIMYTDASTLLLNPLLPLHIFLPPSSPEFAHIHFLASRSPTGTLNADVFFLHIDPWTVKFLIRAMAVPMIDQQVQLGHAMDATAMALVLNETEFRGSAMYQPAGWYHGVQTREGFSGHAGDLLVSLPVELMGERWRFLREWVERLGREGGRYGVSLRETNYPALIATFWERVRRARGVLRDAEEFAERERGDVNEELKRAIGRLKDAIAWVPEREDVLGEAEEACRREMKAPPAMR